MAVVNESIASRPQTSGNLGVDSMHCHTEQQAGEWIALSYSILRQDEGLIIVDGAVALHHQQTRLAICERQHTPTRRYVVVRVRCLEYRRTIDRVERIADVDAQAR